MQALQKSAGEPRQLLRDEASEAIRRGDKVLTEPVAKASLRGRGIAVPRNVVVSRLDLNESLIDFSPPYVLKAVSGTLVHKTDAGAVRLNIPTLNALQAEIESMSERLERNGHLIDSFLVEEDVSGGHEVVVGAVRQEGVGWVVMVGLGGVFVEVLADVAFGLVPISDADATRMLRSLRGFPLLAGTRGYPPADIDALVQLLTALAGEGGLLAALPDEVTEIDLNPVFAGADRAVVADARFVLGPALSKAPPSHNAGGMDFTSLFMPKTVAVLGASTKSRNIANYFIRNTLNFGYNGKLIPVHPRSEAVEGISAVSSVEDLPNDVDYAYVAVPAERAPAAIRGLGGRARFAQVVSSGFSETSHGAELERELRDAAREGNVRLIGPNCLGTHSSRSHLTFVDDAPPAPGTVSIVSQSGGLAVDLLRWGASRGIEFNKVVSLGNGADVSPAELTEHLLQDPDTRVIGLYLESLSAGREVLDVLRQSAVTKPVVFLAGGQTQGGSRAALSHTGALTGNHRLWPALARQANALLTATLPDFVNSLLALQMRQDDSPSPSSSDVILFGNGGGTSVLATDAMERAGLQVPLLPAQIVKELEELGLPPGNGLSNPIDTPAGTLAVEDGAVAERILETILTKTSPGAVICHLNVGVIASNTAGDKDVVDTIVHAVHRAVKTASARPHVLLVLRSDGSPGVEDRVRGYCKTALALGLPVFQELPDAAVGAVAVLYASSVTAK